MFCLSELMQFLSQSKRIDNCPEIICDKKIERFASLAHPSEGALCWTKKILPIEAIPECAVLICLLNQPHNENCKTLMLHVSDPRKVFAEIVNRFCPEVHKIGIDTSAKIDTTAEIGKDVYIGPGCVIAEQCKISDGTIIDANVSIYKGVIVGKNCHICSGAVIGADGHGYTKDDDGRYQKIRHMGSVVIKDNVKIGANSCIDRGVLDDTTVGDNTKIDNNVHVAHNVVIGRNCMIIAGAVICGSSTIRDNVWIGPNSVISNGITINDNAKINIGSVVIENVGIGEEVSGNFAIPHLKHLIANAKDMSV